MTYKEAVEEVVYEFEVGMGCDVGELIQRGDRFYLEIKDSNGFPPADFEEMGYDGIAYVYPEASKNLLMFTKWDVLTGDVVEVIFEFS